MRLHLTIQRHGLPVTRILWTTSPPSLFGHNLPSPSSMIPAASSAITSSRVPNALYANGGYTIAQLLEDVNEVIPLETETRLFEDESSGQWGLEDYAVEVGGSECLHFMEIEGLLRDGDEVLIRALQISDLRARRISGRHQISADGKHLIDGVPFGKPFLKRPTSSRPAITIPPRKKRRTALALWGNGKSYEEEDTEWAPRYISTGKELSTLKPDSEAESEGNEYEDAYQDDYEDYHEPNETGDDTVIRHPIDKTEQRSNSGGDDDVSEPGDLTQELKDLKKDMEISAAPELEKPNGRKSVQRGYPLRSRTSVVPPPTRKSPLSRPSIKRPSGVDANRRDSKAVRFSGQKEPPVAENPEMTVVRAGSTSDSSDDLVSSESDSSSYVSLSSEPESDSDGENQTSSGESSSSSESTSESENSASESEDEEASKARPLTSKVNPPGEGSLRTKKSNQRNKLRRKLAKLKDLGVIDKDADFSDLRKWEDENGDAFYTPPIQIDAKDREQEEFEAKRQKLLRDLESGGVDVSMISEKENLPPSHAEEDAGEDQRKTMEDLNETTPEAPKRRTLDVASTKRLLFGSLGVRAPRSKEDEEATRKKLAGKVHSFVPRQVAQVDVAKKPESEPKIDWRDKLTLGASECVYDDIELTAPPYPFEQHWDTEAGNVIRQRKGWGKKRKRRQQLQVYDGECGDIEDDSFMTEGVELNYDDAEPENSEHQTTAETGNPANGADEASSNDLPPLPNDTSSLTGLVAGDMKPGLVFAFKQLDVSKATNWQPMVSEYRVAEVRDVFEDNIFSIQLAKAYRRQSRGPADGEDGPFQYSGFEMPGLDDEGEDDGFREVPFDDLIDPKLIRAPPVTSVAGTKGDNNPLAAEELPEQNICPPAIEDEIATFDEQIDNQPIILVEDPLTSDPIAKDTSPIQSPRFEGFDPLRVQPERASKACSNPAHRDDTDNGEILSQEKDAASTLDSTCPPNAFPSELPETGLSDQLRTISSPESNNSFQSMMDHLLHYDQSSPFKKSSPASQSSGRSVVPNPFYEIDKAHEERRQRKKKAQNHSSYDSITSCESSAEAPSSPLSQMSAKRERRDSPPTKDSSQVSMVPDSLRPEANNENLDDSQPPPASQIPSEIVDLTQSSPAVSSGGSDKDFAKAHRLPRGSGWVQKNVPITRRQTRQSSAARPTAIPDTPRSQMASRIPRRKKRRSRRA